MCIAVLVVSSKPSCLEQAQPRAARGSLENNHFPLTYSGLGTFARLILLMKDYTSKSSVHCSGPE